MGGNYRSSIPDGLDIPSEIGGKVICTEMIEYLRLVGQPVREIGGETDQK